MSASDRVWRGRGLRAAVLAGDEEAWRARWDGGHADADRHGLWRCGGLRDRADEVVQDVWLTAVRRVRAFHPEAGPFTCWLRGIAANLLRNAFRRERRRGHTEVLGPEMARTDGALEQRLRAE